MTSPVIKNLDLFTGIGGIRTAFESSGFNSTFTNDTDKSCKETHDANFSTSKMVLGDISKIPIDQLPGFDFLTAGFPCQPFSIAGYQKGFQDKGRGDLFFHIVNILEKRNPSGFFLENVKNLSTHNKGQTLRVILDKLYKAGYHVKHAVLNTSEYGGLPQNRERIYIVGFKKYETFMKFNFPNPLKSKTTLKEILLDNNDVDERFFYEGKPLYKRLEGYPFKDNVVYQWRRGYVRENKSGVCPTLTANMGTGGHNVPLIKTSKGIRKLTPRECARLQGLPDSFVLPSMGDYRLYKQMGNTVSIPVVRRIAKHIYKALEGGKC